MGRKVVSPCSCNRSDTTFSCRARVCTAYQWERSTSVTRTGEDVCQVCPLLLTASPSESHAQTRPVSLHMNVLRCRTPGGMASDACAGMQSKAACKWLQEVQT